MLRAFRSQRQRTGALGGAEGHRARQRGKWGEGEGDMRAHRDKEDPEHHGLVLPKVATKKTKKIEAI